MDFKARVRWQLHHPLWWKWFQVMHGTVDYPIEFPGKLLVTWGRCAHGRKVQLRTDTHSGRMFAVIVWCPKRWHKV